MRVPLIFAITVFVLAMIVDSYIWWDIRHYRLWLHRHARRPRLWSRIYAISCIPCWALLIVALSLPRRNGDASIIPVMWMLFTFITIYASKLIFVVFSLLGWIPRLWSRHRYYLGLSLGLPLAISSFIVMWWGALVTRHEVAVTQVEIAGKEVPQGFNGYKIVQFSDVHVGTWGSDTTFMSALVDSINAQKPDLIVFTGDIVNRNSGELKPFVEAFSRLKAKDGIYSVLGNHDYGMYQEWPSESAKEANMQELYALQKEMGWKLLLNNHDIVRAGGDSLMIVGVENWGEPPFDGVGDLDKALSRRYPGTAADSVAYRGKLYKVLLTHNPEHWNQVVSKTSDVDLSLSGHTHAMQMMVKAGNWTWSPAAWRYELWGGMYRRPSAIDKDRELSLYVNIGAGEVGMPFRLLAAKPEITVITLRHVR